MGSYGSVSEALHIPTQTKVAIKRIDSLFEDFQDTKKIVRELLILKGIKQCPYVTRLLDVIP